jgi:hypothetical protein
MDVVVLEVDAMALVEGVEVDLDVALPADEPE